MTSRTPSQRQLGKGLALAFEQVCEVSAALERNGPKTRRRKAQARAQRLKALNLPRDGYAEIPANDRNSVALLIDMILTSENLRRDPEFVRMGGGAEPSNKDGSGGREK